MIDSLLVAFVLMSTGQQQMLDVVLTRDSTLLIPAAQLHAFLDLPPPTTTWTTPRDLMRAYPSVTVTWVPRELRVLIDDPLTTLPASRRMRDQRERLARGSPPITVTRSGPYFAATVDELGGRLLEGGYSWRGRVALSARDSRFGTTWTVSLAPVPAVYVAYSDGEAQLPSVSGRLALGPLWVAPTWRHGHTDVDALLTIGAVSLFASSRQQFALTIRGPIAVQVGRMGDVTTGRVSFGPVPPNPFSVPFVP